MRRMKEIALNTFRETFRDRIVWIIFGFALLMVLLSNLIAYMGTPGKYDDPIAIFSNVGIKIVADMGLTAIWAVSLVISIFIGTGMIHKEIDKRTVYTILSRPVRRWEFIVGKYLGLISTLGVMMLGMSVFYLIHYAIQGGSVDWALIQALIMLFVEMAVVTAMAVFFGSLGSPILSAVITLFFVLIGRMAQDIVELTVYGDFEKIRGILYYVYLVLPHLHSFNLSNSAVHSIVQPMGIMAMSVMYAVVYIAGLLALAALFFRRRNL